MAMQQEPKLEVPIPYIRPIFQAQISGNIPRIHMAQNMVRLRTSICWILEISH